MRLPRLSSAERLILDLLVEHDELFGLQLVEQSGGRLKRGTVYVTLGRMVEKGYLESRQEPLPPGAIGLPRRSTGRPGTRCACSRRGGSPSAHCSGPPPQEA